MKRKKILALLMTLCIAAGSTAACSAGPAASNPGTSSPTASSSSVAQETSGEDSTSASSQPLVSEETGSSSAVPEASSTSSTPESSSKASGSSTPDSSAPGASSAPDSAVSSDPSSKPVTGKPETSTPQTSKPQTSKPETSTPQTSTPQTSKPESSVPETSTPDPVTPISEDYDIGGIELYNQLFDLSNQVTVEISMTTEQMNLLQKDYERFTGRDGNTKSSIYRMATVTFRVDGKSYLVPEVGIRLKGNVSMEPLYTGGKPNICSFKLSFDEAFDDKDDYGTSAKKWTDAKAREARKKRKFATLNELDIKWNICYDETNIREIYATKLFEAADVLVQKIGLSQLKLNGNNYGLVKIYEPIDTTFLRKRLPEAAIGGDLYKTMWSDCNNSGSHTGRWSGATYKTSNSYGVQDNEAGKKYNFNLKTNKKTSKHASLKNFLSVINRSNLTKTDLEKVLDVDYYARFMAAMYFAGDPDDLRNNYNNHYLYFRKDTGKAIFIVYDNDRTMGITYGLNKNCATRNPYSNYAATAGNQENPLISKTITHNALSAFLYIRDGLYKNALDKLASSSLLSNSQAFNRMYTTARGNYEDIITPYTRFANQEQDFKFSLNGNANGGDKQNMSFEQFRSQIIDTYRKSTP